MTAHQPQAKEGASRVNRDKTTNHMTLTPIQKQIRDFIATHPLCSGLGTKESACTIAAINLVISGLLEDERPDCVCPVIHRWVIPIQDAMPNNLRNNGWSQLVPLIAGSKSTPAVEQKRKAIILDWMWGIVLPQLLPVAKKYSFEKEWSAMLELKTQSAAASAARAADAAYWEAVNPAKLLQKLLSVKP